MSEKPKTLGQIYKTMALKTFLHWIMKDSGLWKVNTKWDEPYNCLVLLPGGVQITEGDGEGKGMDSCTVQGSHWVKWKELGVRGTNMARVHRAKYWEGRVVWIEHSAVLSPKAFCWVLESPCMGWNYLRPKKQPKGLEGIVPGGHTELGIVTILSS